MKKIIFILSFFSLTVALAQSNKSKNTSISGKDNFKAAKNLIPKDYNKLRNTSDSLLPLSIHCSTDHSKYPDTESIKRTTSSRANTCQAQSFKIDTLFVSNSPKKRNLIFIPDGFTEAEMPLFKTTVLKMTSKLKSRIPNLSFEAVLVNVPSNESGISDYTVSPAIIKDNYFKSGIGPGSKGWIWDEIAGPFVDAQFPPDRYPYSNRIFVWIINTTIDKLLGFAYIESDGITYYKQVVMSSGVNDYGPNLLPHELGHVFGLGDTYDGVHFKRELPNLTQKTQLKDIVWKDEIKPSIPIPTPREIGNGTFSEDIGLYPIFKSSVSAEPTDWYKPCSSMCIMGVTSKGEQFFCKVCRKKMDKNDNLPFLTVSNGSFGGYFYPGSQVKLKAIAPQSNLKFSHWQSTDIGIPSPKNSNITITMPNADISINAVFVPNDNIISLQSDSGTFPASGGIAIANVRANDKINGQNATSANSLISQVDAWPNGISLNTTSGAVEIKAGTNPGIYKLTYSLCDPSNNCNSTTINITITTAIRPVDDNAIALATGGIAIANVRANDKINGQDATSTNSTISQVGTWPSSITLNTNTGAVEIAPGTNPGNYKLTYRLCGPCDPSNNCNSTTINLTITAVISPLEDNNSISATGGTAITNVRANDKINGQDATSANSVISQVGTWPNGISLNNTSGEVSVVAGTTPGEYTMSYSLCDFSNNCNNAAIKLTITSVISPLADNGTIAATGGTAIPNVRSNDKVNGQNATSANSVISQVGTWPNGISLNTTSGEVSVVAGTTPGEYTMSYSLCDFSNNCNNAAIKLTITSVISPLADNGTISATGGTAIPNVRSNDKVNGQNATSANSVISQVGTWPNGISLNTISGEVSVVAGTTPGEYTISYSLCDFSNNCNNAAIKLTITSVISPLADNGTIAATGGTAIPNVRSNDKINGQDATSANSVISQVGTWPNGISLNTISGEVSVAAGTTSGEYTMSYSLCDPSKSCKNATINLNITSVIRPEQDNAAIRASGLTAISNINIISNIRGNDKVNGQLATSANSLISQVGTWPSGISLNTNTGAVVVAAGTNPGDYKMIYSLCDLYKNCKNAAISISIIAHINPVEDNAVVSALGGVAIVNVRSNDIVNGPIATSANSVISQVGTWPNGISLNNTSGEVSVVAGTTPGGYTMSYSLCDFSNNCNNAAIKLTITSVISPLADNGTIAATGGTAIPNVRSNDKVNGQNASSANSKITQIGSWPTGISLNTNSGAITVAAGTNPGDYKVTYSLCDQFQNCNNAAIKLTITSVISPLADNGTIAATGGTAIPNVRSNDKVNGQNASSANSKITQIGSWPSGISLNNNNGAITVAAGTNPGDYKVTYSLCDQYQNCKNAIANLTITAVINPITDNGSTAVTGGTAITNVRANDKVNGQNASSANSVISQVGTWPNGITLNTTSGAVVVAKNTIAKQYSLTYRLCDKFNNCKDVSISVQVKTASGGRISNTVQIDSLETLNVVNFQSTKEGLINEIEDLEKNTKAYPNPVSNELSIEYFAENENKPLTIDILDIKGTNQIKQKTITRLGINLIKLDVSKLLPGLYIIQTMENNRTTSTKFLKVD